MNVKLLFTIIISFKKISVSKLVTSEKPVGDSSVTVTVIIYSGLLTCF